MEKQKLTIYRHHYATVYYGSIKTSNLGNGNSIMKFVIDDSKEIITSCDFVLEDISE